MYTSNYWHLHLLVYCARAPITHCPDHAVYSEAFKMQCVIPLYGIVWVVNRKPNVGVFGRHYCRLLLFVVFPTPKPTAYRGAKLNNDIEEPALEETVSVDSLTVPPTRIVLDIFCGETPNARPKPTHRHVRQTQNEKTKKRPSHFTSLFPTLATRDTMTSYKYDHVVTLYQHIYVH